MESTSERSIVIRVPAALRERLRKPPARRGPLALVESADVTDQYRDLEKRIEVSEKTRARLYALLDKTGDADERVSILREIRRLTEEIEQLKATIAALDQQIRFSRITVRLIARLAEGRSGAGGAFRLDRAPRSARLRRPPPPRRSGRGARGLRPVLLRPPAPAESAEGTRLRAGAVANDPRGDTEFWRKALLFHLGPRYGKSRRSPPGAFAGCCSRARTHNPSSISWLSP